MSSAGYPIHSDESRGTPIRAVPGGLRGLDLMTEEENPQNGKPEPERKPRSQLIGESAPKPESELLPVLPLDHVVVLPHMTVTLGVEGESQRAAVEAARQGSHLVVLVPRIEGRFAQVGTVARLQDSGQLPNGAEVTILRGEYRARLGGGQADVGGVLWIQAQSALQTDRPS